MGGKKFNALFRSNGKQLSVPISVRGIRSGIGFLTLLTLVSAVPAAVTNPMNCDIQKGACMRELNGGRLTLDIQPKPVKAMQDLLFQLTLSGIKPNADPYIDLGMPGMDMGPNRVILKFVRSDVYEGRGIIVRCPSGRNVWRAKVTVPNIGTVDFVFHVVY